MGTASRMEEGNLTKNFLTSYDIGVINLKVSFRNSRATTLASCIIELEKGDVVTVEKIQAATPHNENANYFEGHLLQ